MVPNLDLAGVTSAGDVKAGFALFHNNCQVCHGPSASGAFLPDLKKSQMLLSADAFKSVVIDGALKANGMASFARFLTPRTPRTSAPMSSPRPAAPRRCAPAKTQG
uniref:C-type cytochrome n=1 Tax=Phenylobacterium glaciei TaxID=2803784 RepID=A0A974P5P0_9CAUL|nr:c-type cytochrome [Phenylobacterium glaciei]